MDEKDLELLRILEDNSRLSAQEIGTMTCLTAAEAETRIHALEAAGVIRKYTTVINWEMAGNNIPQSSTGRWQATGRSPPSSNSR